MRLSLKHYDQSSSKRTSATATAYKSVAFIFENYFKFIQYRLNNGCGNQLDDEKIKKEICKNLMQIETQSRYLKQYVE